MKKIIIVGFYCALILNLSHLNAEEDSDLKLEQEEREQLSDLAAEESVEKDFQKQLAQTGTMLFDRVKGLLKSYSIDSLKKQLNEQNPYRSQNVSVRKSNILSQNEKNYRAVRAPLIRRTLETLLGDDVSDVADSDLTIGFVGSGGGYRAMILTAGYLAGLEKIGLLDSLMYVSSLSGSTWFLAPWISKGQPDINSFNQSLLKKIKDKQFDLLKVEKSLKHNAEYIKTIMNEIIWPKYIFGQPIRSIDLYGFLLSQVLLGNDGYKYHLSQQWDKIKDGSRPFPIYTSVSMHKTDAAEYVYNWYEFNPIEVRNTNLDLSIPSFSFNSEFNNGKSVEIAPEQPLGYLMAIFGSAYAINFKDISRMVGSGLGLLKNKLVSFENTKYILTMSIINSIESIEGVGKLRFSPAQILNPFKGMATVPQWLNNRQYVTLVDGGIAYNIPAKPLLAPARKVKILIIGDSSSNALSATELKLFFADAQKNLGYNYSRIDDRSNSTISLYKDLKNDNAPRIIYLNFFKNQKLMTWAAQKDPALKQLIMQYDLENFDPIKCLNEACGTFNFDYTEQEFNQLSNIASFNLQANKEVIINFIKDELIKHLEDEDFPVFGHP